MSLLLAKTAVRGDAKSATLGREKSHFPHPKVALLLRHASLFSVSVGFLMHSCHGSSARVVHVLETCVPCESLCRVSFEKKPASVQKPVSKELLHKIRLECLFGHSLLWKQSSSDSHCPSSVPLGLRWGLRAWPCQCVILVWACIEECWSDVSVIPSWRQAWALLPCDLSLCSVLVTFLFFKRGVWNTALCNYFAAKLYKRTKNNLALLTIHHYCFSCAFKLSAYAPFVITTGVKKTENAYGLKPYDK